MKTKLAMLTMAALFGVGVSAMAQDGPPPGPRGPKGPPPPEVIKKFDKDGDGKLSEEERAAMKEARHKENLAKYDTDKDGKLSDAEREAMRAAKKKDRKKVKAGSPELEALVPYLAGLKGNR